MGILSRGYRMGIPDRVQFLLIVISKAFIALNFFIPKFNYFILFCVFYMVSLKILTLLS